MAILVFQTLKTKAERTAMLEECDKTVFGQLLSDALDVGRLAEDLGDKHWTQVRVQTSARLCSKALAQQGPQLLKDVSEQVQLTCEGRSVTASSPHRHTCPSVI